MADSDSGPGDAAPVTPGEFARAMAALDGFEPAPAVAVGLSGGGDSLALVLLLRHWVAERGGNLLALTVDHGLRAESADEAAVVGTAMARIGIPHRILRWAGDKPVSGLQAAARAARHRLLADACVEAGILHLALAHHRDDQAETVLLRLARGSGTDGLAGMAAVRADGAVRVIRPLLGFSHDRLLATCRAAGLEWVEDPSNHNPRFARARLRAARDLLGGEGLDGDRLCEVARRAGRARAALEQATADLLAQAATIHPEGWVTFDPVPLLAAPEEIALRALAQALAAVGGAGPVRDEALERLLGSLADGQGGTLGGCVVRMRRGAVMVAREPAAAVERLLVPPGGRVLWDGRFDLQVSHRWERPVEVAAIGAAGWRKGAGPGGHPGLSDLPVPVRESLPSLWLGTEMLAIPTIGGAYGFDADGQAPMDCAIFRPISPLGRPAFTVVSDRRGII
ncbi:tRNA lysidine(34) synthetase TilS [Azospirillum lipoferum]|uniref:tRNA(Ile)-lysidine synthase n=1 Tax=Azospirillum lipoferum (strain 4B) TaxID=862719 RepID=G7Z9M6_AZOL4|nr:tRNA lysidine(34) synthetase TilS [Azospirillum lipoferum]CBS86181.1 tRNA(Ile)-lysidine synthase [Azospirillum lipoferum 4B]